jgi:hypothetical protein
VLVSAYLELAPGGPDGSAEVWEWDHFRVEAEPQLTYPGCDDFDYNNMRTICCMRSCARPLTLRMHESASLLCSPCPWRCVQQSDRVHLEGAPRACWCWMRLSAPVRAYAYGPLCYLLSLSFASLERSHPQIATLLEIAQAL